MGTTIETLMAAQKLIAAAISEEQIFGEGVGANYIVFDCAERMVADYAAAVEKGVI